MANLIALMPGLNRARVALSKMRQITDLVEVNTLDQNIGDDVGGVCLSLNSVRFRYPGSDDDFPFVVGPISLTMASSEVVFLIGGNGSGKSTLLKLISGLYEPSEGSIRLNHLSSDEERYRNNFSAVFSDNYLMPYIIDRTGDAVEHAQAAGMLRKLYLEDKVGVKSGKLSTVKLSQGQRKRLALLVSYFEEKRILIFDEWAADQDLYFKEIFYRELLPKLKSEGKLVIVVSHDERYFSAADRIYRLEEGKLSELHHDEASAESIRAQFIFSYAKQGAARE